MKPERSERSTLPSPATAVPSKDGLRLVLAGTAYLIAICLLQLAVMIGARAGGASSLPGNVMEVRDVVALFGWVGLMITGVSVIIIPNHLKVRLRPKLLPRLHLALANAGLVGYLGSSLIAPGSTTADLFLAVTSASFLAFGAGVLRTILPFVRSTGKDASAGPFEDRANAPAA